MSRIVTFSPESKKQLIEGVNILADAVGVTLGPKGRNVVIDTFGVPTVTKDGVTVAREINLTQPIQKLGANIIKQAASKTANNAGDGTTTATVLAQALINNGQKLIEANYSPIDIKRGYESLLSLSLEQILLQSKPVTLENIKQIATISANNDESIGNLIYTGFEFVGMQGMIAVEDSKTGETTVKTIDGTELNTGYASPYFVTDQEKMECIYEKPLILITDKKIRTPQEIIPALEIANRRSRPLLIIADEIEAHAFSLLIVNKVRAGLPVVAVRAPGFGERRSEILQDLAVLLNGTIISDAQSLRLEDIKEDQLGTCDRVVINKDSTLILRPAGAKENINTRIEQLKLQINDPANTQYAIDKITERISNLSGKVAVLAVGAATETELKEKKDRVDDALRATKAAISLGYVPGAGYVMATIDLSEAFKENIMITDAFKGALEAPARKILTNANVDATHILNQYADLNVLFNSLAGEFEKVEETSVIDPTQVLIESLTNAVSAANMILLSEVTVHDKEEKYDPRMGTEIGYE